MDRETRMRRIWDTIADIPPGFVANYGQVAEIAGIPRGARQVGYALSALKDESVPWHRVVNAKGEQVTTYEVQLKHPGQVRVTTRRSADAMSRDYEIWLSDGETATTSQAAPKLASLPHQLELPPRLRRSSRCSSTGGLPARAVMN